MGWLGGASCLLLAITGVAGFSLPAERDDWAWTPERSSPNRRVVREVTLGERKLCGDEDQGPFVRIETAARVAMLRAEMASEDLEAYIIPTDDEHQSEYVADADKRRQYISGFSGSAGTAIVTMDLQALWTDGRYFLQADDELDCNWLLMKQKNPGVPKMMDWLKQKLIPGSRVGADPRLIGADTWKKFADELEKAEIVMVPVERNLVDAIWPVTERPPYSQDPIYVHELQFAGKKWEDKVADVRIEMEKEGADLLVLTALDEIAWLLNLRGNDIPYNPVFRSYVVVGRDVVELYIPGGKITPTVDNHLRVNQCGGQECVVINEYTAILNRLRALEVTNGVEKVMMGSKYSYSGGASYAIYSAVREEKRLMVTSPVLLMKSRKNPVEVQGMINSHVKDAVALCDFLAFLEKEIGEGRYWSEISAAEKLTEYRAQQKDFMGMSFTTISAYGPNGAIIHYHPLPETNLQISNTSLYLLDSGGQYKDGTTDVTRTMHYGDPTPYQIETYTRVLMGAIDLAMLIIPEGTGDSDVDIVARRYLYEVGLDYRHGTGHGIGHFLNVHEASSKKLLHDFFGSHEPGFYQDHEFGIRLETIMRVVPKQTQYHFDKQSLGFEAVTLAPFEAKLINVTMLSGRQCHWLNAYHARVRDVIGGELMTQDRSQGYEWLVAKTKPLSCAGGPFGDSRAFSPSNMSRKKREIQNITLEMRTNCKVGDPQPSVRVDTTDRVAKLRQQMTNYNVNAYLVPSDDEHLSEYVADADKRRQYISGFSGSAGTAIVTMDLQALWTDGRYFLQADDELDCNWILMKDGVDGVPKEEEWLARTLQPGARVGADPRLHGSDYWKEIAEKLAKSNIELVPIETNLVDLIWPSDVRPQYSKDPIFIHEIQFAGKKWEDKVSEVRAEMESDGADMLVLTSLDEVAWLLNVRGNDIPHNPVFRSYVIIGRSNVELFIPAGKITPAVDMHLNVNQCGEQECVIISEYTAILDRLRALELNTGVSKVMLGKKYSYSGGASYAVYSAVPERKRHVRVSPVLSMKARKSPEEIQGMKKAHVRDAVAVSEFLAFMEREIAAGNAWDEIEAATKLEELRREQDHFVDMSFKTISAFGSNGAVIHYRPQPKTAKDITADSLYLVDSGGQYKDGTTDVTRTMHYGTPTPFQIEAYTRVLKGAIDLALLTFPEGTSDTGVDIIARKSLFDVGLNYRHGTGHGIGYFLNVHEAPLQVRIYGKEKHKFEVGHFFSDEPGYYQDNEWGIRLETILSVVTKETKYKFGGQWLGFEAITLVPFESKLINSSMLSNVQCHWLNSYHARVLEVVGTELRSQGRVEAYDWLVLKTDPLVCAHVDERTTSTTRSTSTSTAYTSTSTSTLGTTTRQHASTRTIEYTTSAIATFTEAAVIGANGHQPFSPSLGLSVVAVVVAWVRYWFLW
ncbi:uncharacterized protein LOC122261838 isoform X2 [Penaeus japonicus]|uniref:uncharacterized protein LOC122261838 isoform X2 n=1 Tax=Penaeus japonicus TaxID=27405 RepID=UPI001C7161DC|nr:uncharacterized protein LOC122261838 isoform X2 [Penaeus japonicus]